MVAHTCNLSTWEAEAGESFEIQGQTGIHNNFQPRVYSRTPCEKHKTPFVGVWCLTS